MGADQTLQYLIDVRSRLDDVVKAQAEFRKMREEVTSTGQALKTGVGIELAHRGLDLLTGSLREFALESIRLAGSIKDGARNLEISNQAYQVLGNLIQDAGGDMSLLTQAISNNNRSLVEARTIGSAAAGAYRTLGLDIAKLEQIPAERRFEVIGRAVLGATDKTQAYSAASQILGSRNLPTLLGALKDLAENGWDKVTDAQQRAGRVMNDDTIMRLEAAQKAIEKLKQSMIISTGEAIASTQLVGESFLKERVATLQGLLAVLFNGSAGLASLGATVAKNVPAATATPPGADGAGAAAEIALKNQLASAEYNLAAAMLHRQTIENDPNFTGLDITSRHLAQLQNEVRLRAELIAATKAAPLDPTETSQARDLRVQKLQEQNQQLRDEIRRIQNANQFNDAAQASQDKFTGFRNDAIDNKQGLGSSLKLGAMDWVTGLGSSGQQAAGVLQSTLGAAVSGIGDGILGWITHTKSFGAAMLNLGQTVFSSLIDAIIQMGVQWLLTQLLIKTGMITTHAVGETLRAGRIAGAVAEGAATTAALAPAAATASISSFGLAAIIGITALVAALAVFGGAFAEGGVISGPGSGTSDSILARVSNGEGILTAATVSRLGPGFVHALNAGAPVAVAASAAPALGGRAAGAAPGGRESARNTHIYLDRSAWLDAVQNDLSGIAHEVYDRRARA